MKMDNPTTISVIGGIIAAIIIAGFSIWAGAIQKKQSDADKADLMLANRSLDSTIKQKNEELVEKSDALAKKSDDLAAKSDEHAKKLEIYSDSIKQYSDAQKENDEKIKDLQSQIIAKANDQLEKSGEIAKLSAQLSERTTELLNTVTSKGSFCFIVIHIDTTNYGLGKPSVANVILYHSGNYSLKNVQISIVNSDEEAYDESGPKPSFDEDPIIFKRPSHPYTQTVAVLSPNQHIFLKNIDIINRNQKSFNVYFISEYNFWFQRILLRNASAYGGTNRNSFYYLTQVYVQDLDPKLNQVHRFEDIVKENSNYTNKEGFDINKKIYQSRKWEDFLFTADEKNGKYVNWFSLHWNGNNLETGRYNLPSYKK